METTDENPENWGVFQSSRFPDKISFEWKKESRTVTKLREELLVPKRISFQTIDRSHEFRRTPSTNIVHKR